MKHVSLVENAHSESFTFIVEDFIITSNKDFIQVFSILIALHHEFILALMQKNESGSNFIGYIQIL